MKDIEDHIRNLYQCDEYLNRNDLDLSDEGGEHIKWKVKQILPLIDQVAGLINKNNITILDVGGGVGLVLKGVSKYINDKFGLHVKKYALDLSPGFVEMQRKRNPDLFKALNEDIRKTSLHDKEIDLSLMIDVLEHVPNPELALKELRRISRYVIFKIPLEDNLLLNTYNRLTGNMQRKRGIQTVGHINFYNNKNIFQLIEENTGEIMGHYFTNVFEHYRRIRYYENKSVMKKVVNDLASYVFRISPKVCSMIFNDFIMLLVRCR